MQNYHKHSHISNIILADSVVTNEEYCKRARELGHSIISSCEHGTQGDYRECADLAGKYGLKWRYVTEAYFVEDRNPECQDKNNCHIVLAAKTEKGIGDLNEALSEANISGYYFRPRVDMEILLSLDPKDVFVTTACLGGVWRYGFIKEGMSAERWDEMRRDREHQIEVLKYTTHPDDLPAKLKELGLDKEVEPEKEVWHYDFTKPDEIVRKLHAHFGDSFMLEVQYHDVEKQKVINRHILELYRKYGIPMIVGLDSHFIYPEQEILRAQRLEANHIIYENEDGFYMDYPSDDEVYNRFIRQGVLSPAQIREAMDNTDIFLTFEDVTLDKSMKLPTIDPDLTQEERNEKYRQLIRDRWKDYRRTVPKERWPEYLEGIRYEVDTITQTNMSDYFLISHAFVEEYRKQGGSLTFTGRGSAPSYFTNMLVGLTSIDRYKIPVTMYPDRFISKDRLLSGSAPDIDNNVGDQALGSSCLAAIMGEWRSAPMVAYGTLKRLSAWKMYCRAENIPFEQANAVSDNLKKYELDVKHAEDDAKDEIDVFEYVPQEYHEQLRMSEKYLGMIDSISPHPCAHLLTNEDIRREIGIYRINSKSGKKKIVYAAFIDGQTADRYGYLKQDVLAVDVVKVNADIYRRIGIPQPTVPQLMELVEGDKPTWEMYAKGYTLGLNQAERDKSTEKVMRYKPKNLSELSAFVAGIRPAFQSKVNDLLDRRHFDYGIPVLDELLQTPEMPSSFILYQEQMMKVLQYAGFSAPDSYSSIKAIAKKHPEKVLPLKEKFLEGFASKLVASGISQDMAEETSSDVWQIISDACGYGFNSCLPGDESIYRDSNGKFMPTISEMYFIKKDKQYAKETGHESLHDKYNREGYGKAWSMMEDGRLRKNRIVDIRYAGHRKVYKITTSTGREVRATDNHKFPVGRYDNLVCLSDLRVGDKLFCTSGYEKCTNKYAFTDGNYESNIPVPGQKGFQSKPDGDTVVYHRERKRHEDNRDCCECCKAEFDGELRFELHHEDGKRTNNTPENLRWLCVNCHKKKHFRELGRTRKGQKGYPTHEEEIVSIDFVEETDVYDVEMEHPYHNFLLASGIVTGNSHSVSVAFDSLYTAYAKAHYPYETYVALMSNYAEKGDKERIDRARIEMKRAFGITVVPCRFRQDNRDFYIDKENKTISDTLMSVKHISKRVADELYRMRNNQYSHFVDLLIDMQGKPVFDSRVNAILIQMGYFQEFGSSGKLLAIKNAFEEGPMHMKKTLTEKTREKRRLQLYEFEDSLEESEIPMAQQLRFEVEHFGTPVTVYQNEKKTFFVLDVDEKYSPKIRLYNVSKGTVGIAKVKKKQYASAPICQGDCILIDLWSRKPCYKYSGGKSIRDTEKLEVWLDEYRIR